MAADSGTATRQRRTAKKDPGTVEQRAPVTLISEAMNHHIIVEPAEEWYTNTGSRQTQNKGIMLRFNNYRCTVPADVADLVRELPCFTGVGARKEVWVEGEWETPDARLRTTQGPILAPGPRGQVAPPHPQWDSLGPEEIESILAEGGVDLERALLYEKGTRNRGVVRGIVAAAIVRETSGEDAAPAAVPVEKEVSEVPDSFGPELTTQPGGVV